MKIENINKGPWGNTQAFFDIKTNEGIVIKGFKLVEGINGLFVSMPSRKGKDQQGEDKWFDTIWIEDQNLRNTLNQLALDAYNGDVSNATSSQESNKTSVTGMSESSESKNTAPDKVESEDEIPF